MSAHRYELSTFIGPCTEAEAIALSDAIMELAEFNSVGGGGIGMRRVDDDDPLFADSDLVAIAGPPHPDAPDYAAGEVGDYSEGPA